MASKRHVHDNLEKSEMEEIGGEIQGAVGWFHLYKFKVRFSAFFVGW
jgi:hypothetical protein